MDLDLVVCDAPTEAMRDAILDPLIAYNDRVYGAHGWKPFAVLLRDPATQAVLGGLWGEHVFDWVHIMLLAVPEAQRRAGYGTRVMQAAEAFARQQNAVGLWLDTYSFQARGFYEKLGYACFGELPGHPRGGTRYFMERRL